MTNTTTNDLIKKEYQTYEGALELYKKNPKALLGKNRGVDNLGNTICYNVVKSEFHQDNEIFKKMVDIINQLSEDELFGKHIDFRVLFYTSSVEIAPQKHINRQHNLICIESSVGLIRFGSHHNGLEITRVIAGEKGKGKGKLLMDIFFNILIAACGKDIINVPIMLECTGAVGRGSNFQSSTIALQTKFFRKFGFRVNPKVSNYSNNYVQMEWKPELSLDYFKKMEKIFLVESN